MKLTVFSWENLHERTAIPRGEQKSMDVMTVCDHRYVKRIKAILQFYRILQKEGNLEQNQPEG
jgi:hypothetical protein